MTERKDFWQRNDANLEYVSPVCIFSRDYFAWRNLYINFISDQNFFISANALSKETKGSVFQVANDWLMCRLFKEFYCVKINNFQLTYDCENTVKR